MLQMFHLYVAKVDRVLQGVASGYRCCWGAAMGQPTWVSLCGARVLGRDADVDAGAA
jgi:hypothetical protein